MKGFAIKKNSRQMIEAGLNRGPLEYLSKAMPTELHKLLNH